MKTIENIAWRKDEDGYIVVDKHNTITTGTLGELINNIKLDIVGKFTPFLSSSIKHNKDRFMKMRLIKRSNEKGLRLFLKST
jgi:hypothetical protein